MRPFRTIQRARQLTVLCVLLLALSGLAQAIHLHPQEAQRGDADKTRCSLCVAGHAPQQATAKVDVVPPQPSESFAIVAVETPTQAVSRKASRIRPPPVL